jgi:3-phenylpropionate/trans-cinnamate dioxygenase ferredoxin reductase subunit
MSHPQASDSSIVIVGASLAGLRAAEEIRHLGHKGAVVVMGDELHAPYDRPPLSKQLLSGKWDVARIHHHAPEKLDTLGLEFRLGRRATGLDTQARTVSCSDGSEVHYDGLVIATGARARWLPGTEGMAGVRTLRTLDDCLGLRADFQRIGGAARLVVIGAGFIGAEVAATCHGLGADVTIVEALPTPLAGAIGEQMGEACAGLHRDAGVALRVGVGVERVVPSSDGTSATVVHLTDGTALPADVVVVGIGVEPVVDWLGDSGVSLDNGVVCDDRLFAADNVVAAGDVARWTHVGLGEDIRIEHWTNAAEGGAVAARNLMVGSADAESYAPVPFFWSDQYGAKIQVIGRPRPEDEVVVVDGTVQDRKLVALYRRGDRLSAALAISRPRQLMAYRPLLDAGASFDDALGLSRA